MNRDAQNDCSEDNANNEVDVAVMGWVMVVGPLSHGFREPEQNSFIFLSISVHFLNE